MVDISSQNNKINVTVSSSGNTANTNVTPDYAQYYSEKSKEWAISNRIVDNTDYSSKYYANESKKQADISTAKATEVIESGNTAISNIENARDNAIIDVNTAGATQVALATEQATIATSKTTEVVASGNAALANIDTAKNNAITSITNQETTSKTSLIDEGATQVGLIKNEGATQVANVRSTGFYMRDDKLYFINSQGEETEFKSGGSGLEVCDIGMALYVDETKGLRRYLNGQIVDINTNTQAFLNRLKQITTLHPSLLCTEEEWQTAKTMSAFGQVGKFVFNYSGDDIVSVRIPRVVNVQGLFDLQNLGMTVSAGLPNITGSAESEVNFIRNGQGAFSQSNQYAYTIGATKGAQFGLLKSFNFDASRSSSVYGNSDTVQQEQIQYPYFIQIATGSETENNIINEIELNNPYSLFDSKYSDHELNNLSWLKSEGQWNAKSVYPTAYDKLLKAYNGTETVEGLSVKLSTEEYTDYDFVLNTSDETFRLPVITTNRVLVAKKEATSEDLSWYNWYSDGWLEIGGSVESAASIAVTIPISFLSTDYYAISTVEGTTTSYTCSVVIDSPSQFSILAGVTSTCTKLWQACGYAEVPTENNNLYYYVGETVQNANLIDAGRIGEQLVTKTDRAQAAAASIPDYSSGVTQYVDTEYTATIDGFIFVFVYGNMEGHLSVNGIDFHIQNGNAGSYYVGASCFMPIGKNDVYKFTWSGGSQYKMSFFPMKGANNA